MIENIINDNPFQVNGMVTLEYNVNYCGTFTDDYSARVEIQAAEIAEPVDPLSEIDIELKAIDPDEDLPQFDFLEFSSDDFRGRVAQTQTEPRNVLKMAVDKVADLVAGIYTVLVSATDSNLEDTQNVRILVDRPIETSVSLQLPYEGIESSLGDNRYLVSREDPIYLSAIIPGDSYLQAEFSDEADLVYLDESGNVIDRWNVPPRTTLQGDTLLCYNLPSAIEPVVSLTSPPPECGSLENIPQDSIQTFQNTFQADGTVRLEYNVNYCGTFIDDYSAEAEIIAVDCLPHRNLNHPWPFPNDDMTYGTLVDENGVERTDFNSYAQTEPEDIHPFEATHACCNPADYSFYTAEDEKECFRNPEPLCDKTLENGHNAQTNLGYIQVQETQNCNGNRGNVCGGNKKYGYWDGLMICGVNSRRNGCSNIATACQGELAFSYTIDSGGNPGWCSGRMGCENLCQEEGVVLNTEVRGDVDSYSDTEINLEAKDRGIMNDDDLWRTVGFKCGCSSPADNGAPCDGNYDNFFDEICYQGVCSERELQRAGSYRCREDDRTVEQLNEYQTEWNYVTTCDEDRYCQIRDNEYSCPEIECTPPEQPKCYIALPQIAKNRFMTEATAEEYYSGFLIGLVAQCEEPGRYEELAWFAEERTVNGEEVAIPMSCGSDGYDVLVNEGTEDERWAGRPCREGDHRPPKDCYAFDGEWEDGVCRPGGPGSPPYCG